MPELSKPPSPLILFGGTFDPVHLGHINLANSVLSYFQGSSLLFIPCRAPLLKAPSTASREQRVSMLRMAIAPYPRMDVSLKEIERSTPSYTIDTLQSFREELGRDTSICLLLGLDTFKQLPQWHRWEELLHFAHLLIVPRAALADSDLPSSVQELLRRHEHTDPLEIARQPCGIIHRYDAGFYDVSSTKIRLQIQQHADMTHYLPKAVYEFIRTQGLYQ